MDPTSRLAPHGRSSNPRGLGPVRTRVGARFRRRGELALVCVLQTAAHLFARAASATGSAIAQEGGGSWVGWSERARSSIEVPAGWLVVPTSRRVVLKYSVQSRPRTRRPTA